MASPEVERPMTSPSHPIVPGGYPRPPVSSSSEKRKAFNFRYKKFGSFANSSQQQKTGFGNSISSAAAAAAAASAAAAARRSSGSGSGPKTSGSIPVRKRSYSFSEGHSKSVTSVTPSKRWKKSKDAKKFLHGGNIRDPLNLNSLSDEKVAKVVNAVTPKSSPIPTPKHRKAEYKIEVFIPPNISDPLNLMQDDINDDEYDASFKQKKSRPRKRNHNRKPDGDSSPKAAAAAAAAAAVVEEVKKVRFQEEIHEENYKKVTIQHQEPSETIKDLINMEEITAEEKETKITTTNPPNEIKSSSSSETPTRTGGKKRRQTFEYGNYSRYYGYRRDPGDDSRLQYFNPDWFRGKDILDIGCNVGEVIL
jgi:7SK snRNA methylphosphate capping enzyme